MQSRGWVDLVGLSLVMPSPGRIRDIVGFSWLLSDHRYRQYLSYAIRRTDLGYASRRTDLSHADRRTDRSVRAVLRLDRLYLALP